MLSTHMAVREHCKQWPLPPLTAQLPSFKVSRPSHGHNVGYARLISHPPSPPPLK
ncbi:hypothetical protein B0T16DRAFT_399895 [Cercophora newfieldiana]|uniref:Uncharacterized protein n=1 Tax=Cercophora newfieldiana TaxID=92897 RepID=A0AA40CZY0_9PEZI|nr:hypothetical protein B0T16DRAFT_399895 [Cercophora newfieldiana]